ncbi:uncharacterized protein N7484_002873 [Penicillium longicatenatum]|uniref:uncharacterized protein n=1 Tax=Penicillium longicatenatum TaxID=1561947 RepID=UPI002546F74D|nr:uncharacterized protein N7484_002873 [Penicillium longicatenatum]KAJ5649150.1 hypothetical protein N7484_002873 [Penicillium longicatenatum]
MTVNNFYDLQTICLRTCYDPRFEEKYQKLLEASGASVLDYIRVLDDSTRYDIENRSKNFWRQVLIQEQCDEVRELALAGLRVQAGIYLLDKDSIKSGVITVLWLDEHGDLAWESRLDPLICDLEDLAVAMEAQPINLVDITDCDGRLVPWVMDQEDEGCSSAES